MRRCPSFPASPSAAARTASRTSALLSALLLALACASVGVVEGAFHIATPPLSQRLDSSTRELRRNSQHVRPSPPKIRRDYWHLLQAQADDGDTSGTSEAALGDRRNDGGIMIRRATAGAPDGADTSDDGTRRQFLAALSAAALAATTALPGPASASTTSTAGPLEDLDLGVGRWVPKKVKNRVVDDSSLAEKSTPELLADERIIPAPFAAYATRFLLRYDTGMGSWWDDEKRRYSLLSQRDRADNLGRSFGCVAASVRNGLERYVLDGADWSGGLERGVRERFGDVAALFTERYGGKDGGEAARQIEILFAMLPGPYQPEGAFRRGASAAAAAGTKSSRASSDDAVFEYTTESEGGLPPSMSEDLSALLPPAYRATYDVGAKKHTVVPRVTLFSIGIDDEFGQNAVATPFGPVSSAPLRREYVPDPAVLTYALFGLSGGAGCALTHATVIPLDVVKTRLQTDPDAYDGIVDGAATIWRDEGPSALLLGAQATIAGYLWYGVSVYPSYSWFKHVIACSILAPEFAAAHGDFVAVVAGALSAVLASIGLTPLEAARIRTVAEPDAYREGGLGGALRIIATEDPRLGAFRSLYAGFPSLVTRQIVFGSLKFLSFERACAFIYGVWPFLRDETVTSLAVSLVAGGMAGVLSSVVSQPADSVLTYIAQNDAGGAGGTARDEGGRDRDGDDDGGGGVGLSLVDGARLLVEEDGPGALFRGLGSRCLWAGSIIAGQFFLYDIFRTAFHVNADDLTQVFEVIIR